MANATATPGTIPALTQYQPGALPAAGTEAFEIVNNTNATSAASYYWLVTDAVGKAPSVLPSVNASSGDMIAIFQAASGLPRSTLVGNLGAAFGNLPLGGTQGQLLTKNSAANYDASWNSLSLLLSAGTGLASAGSTTLTLSLAAFAVVNGYLATPQLVTTSGAVTLATTAGRVLFTTASAGTCFIGMPNATAAGGPILLKDIKGNVSATAPLVATFTAGQLADGLATVSITVPYGAYWLNPLTNGAVGSWYITVA